MKKLIIVMSVVSAGIFLVCFSFGTADAQWWKKDKKAEAPAKKEAPKKEKTKPAAPKAPAAPAAPAATVEDLSKEEIVARLNNIFQYRLDIRESIQGVVENKDARGVFYAYNGAKIEDMDKDSLLGLLKLVNNQISLKNIQNLQRTQKQLNDLKRMQDFERQQKQLRDLKKTSAPAVPKVYKPPRKY